MVQTRRATQVTPGIREEHTSRPRKRFKNDRPAASATTEPDRASPNMTESDGQETSHKPDGKTQGEKADSPPPPRVVSPWKVGAHVSAAGGVANAVANAARVRANAFGLFVKSQRRWTSPALTDDDAASFRVRLEALGYAPRHVLPHGSYLVNLGNPDGAKRDRSYACFVDDLERCERLGLVYYNFHPGSTVGNATREESIALIAQCLNRAHKETSSVITVLENMSGAKNIIGSRFTELRDIINRVDDKSRVGVCLDTCHLYAAGYDISTKAGWDSTLATFDDQVGLSYLCAMHLNDSKTPLGSKKDRHDNIGLGTLGLSAFVAILSDPRVRDMPLILETPTFEAEQVWECEIGVLNRLSEMSSGGEGDDARREELEGMVGDIRSVIREYQDRKAKKKTLRSMAKSKRRKRADEEEDVSDSDGAHSCTEREE